MSALTQKKTAVLLVVSFFIIFPAKLFGEALALEEARQRAASDSPTVRVSEAEHNVAKAGIQEANALFLPQFHISETYLRTDDPVKAFGGKLQQGKFSAADFALSNLNSPSSINHWVTRFELAQPLFHSGAGLAHRRGAVAAYEARGHLESFSRLSARLAATRLYYTGVALARQMAVLSDGIGRLRRLDASYEPAQAATSASTTSALVARSVRLNLEAIRLKVEGERKKVLRDLNVVMGQSPDTPLALTDPLPAVRGIKRVRKEIDEVDNLGRDDLKAAAAGVRGAESARDGALRRWGPEVNFFGAYNLFTGNFSDSETSYEAGVRLDWAAFDWSRHGRIQRTKAEVQRARASHRGAELQAAADIETARSNVNTAVETYRILQRAHSAADEGVRIAAQRYQEGTLPLMDYSQAIQNWVQMRMHLNEGHLFTAVALAEYAFQKGDL